MGSFSVDPSGEQEATTGKTWSNSSREIASVEFAERRIERLLWTYGAPVIVTVGTVGNVLSLAVLLRSRMRSTSVYFYLTMLSCADTMVLYVSAFKTWIRVITGFELLTASNFCCKSIFFLTLLAFHLSAWLVVLVTLDRFIVVWFPLKATTLCALSRARIGAGALIAVITVSNLHVFWTFALVRNRDGVTRCFPVKEHAAFVGLPFHVMKLVTYSVLPFLTILVLNVAIIVRIRRSPLDHLQGHESSHRQRLFQSHDDYSYRRARCSSSASSVSHADCFTKGRNSAAMTKTHVRLTYMLLSVSISWLLLTAPWTVETLVNQKHSEDARTRAREKLVKTVCFMLYYINHSVNFFLYCVTGNRFRRELADLFAQVVTRVRRPPAPPVHSPSSVRRTGRSNCVELDAGPVGATAGSQGRTSKTSRLSDSRL